MVMNYMSKEDKLRFDECNFAGFYTVYRTARQYPRKVGGNLLGYVGEVNSEMLRRYPSYQAGEYVGISGVESAYEPELRGKKGVKISEVDTHGAIKGSYMDGRFDSLPYRQVDRLYDRCAVAALRRGADGRQSRGGRGDRTFDGRDSDDGFLAHVRSR